LWLNHELQVHQIELEMQNAELRQSREELETALEQYTDLYEFAPVGYVTLDRTGEIRRVNLAGSRLMGVERSRLMGRRFGLFVTVETRAAFSDFVEKVFAGKSKETCEVGLRKEGDSESKSPAASTDRKKGQSRSAVAVTSVQSSSRPPYSPPDPVYTPRPDRCPAPDIVRPSYPMYTCLNMDCRHNHKMDRRRGHPPRYDDGRLRMNRRS
jgi:PAS domain S-box-containing protein